MNNKVSFTVCGMNYHVTTDESVEYTEALANDIQEKMSAILQRGFLLNSTQAAVLTALEYADKFKKSEQEVASLRGQMKDYLEDSAKAKSERDYYKRELERYKTEAKFKNDQINLFAGVKDKNEEKN